MSIHQGRRLIRLAQSHYHHHAAFYEDDNDHHSLHPSAGCCYAIDLGNTALKVLYQHTGTQCIRLLQHWILAEIDVDTLASHLQAWLEALPIETVIYWISTNPTIEAQLFQRIDASGFSFLHKPTLLERASNGGVDFTYYQASWDSIGMDRVLNVLHLATCFPLETTVLIHAGSATTIDLLYKGETYGGGAILPSVFAWQQALPLQAPHLPLPLPIETTPSNRGAFCPPASTQAAVTHGVTYPYAMGILGYTHELARYWQAVSASPLPLTKIVVAGGYAQWLYTVLASCHALAAVETASTTPSLLLERHWYNQAIFAQL
jgi:pantothenate kinase type III